MRDSPVLDNRTVRVTESACQCKERQTTVAVALQPEGSAVLEARHSCDWQGDTGGVQLGGVVQQLVGVSTIQ